MRKIAVAFLFLFIVILLGRILHHYCDIYMMPHVQKHRDMTTPREINGIPLVVYQSWGSHFLPRKMRETVLKNSEMNPEFDFYLFSDNECRQFIKQYFSPEVVWAFDTLRPGAYKSDLWRYCVLYVKGGVYFDIKLEAKVPLVDLVKIQPTIFVKDYVSTTKNYDCLWNGLMISAPGNKIFKACIEEIVENCRKKDYRQNQLDITGPCLLGRMVKRLEPTHFLEYAQFVLSNNKIIYNSKVIFEYYKEYRKEQTKWQKGEYYGKLYKEHRIYQE